MATYNIPVLTGVPGFPAGDFDWWTANPPANPGLRYSPENPNWLGAFSLSEGDGANRHVHFRALHGTIGAKPYLFLSWVIRVASVNTSIDRVNFVLGDGANFVAFQAKVGTPSSKSAGKQNDGFFTYRIHNCTVSGTAISQVSQALAVDGADLEATGRMWVNVTNAERLLQTKWAFQVAVPLGVAWAPSSLTLPVSGAFKLWYEVWTSVAGMTVLYQVPTTPPATTGVLQVVPPGLEVKHFLDLTTAGNGTEGVTLDWGSAGARNVNPNDPARPDTSTIRLDLGREYPPNKAMPAHGGTPYPVGSAPDVTSSKFQNEIFAKPTFQPTHTSAQQSAVSGRFSLANWGSQLSIATSSSWRPIPGGQSVNYQTAAGEMKFVWPLPQPGGTADAFTTNLVGNIKNFLNAEGAGAAFPSNAQHPHQCMLVELFSSDPTVIITRSSIYMNMNVARASVFRRFAQVSVSGLKPISQQPRDVFLYVQKFNMPQVVTDDGRGTIPRPTDRLDVITTGRRQQFNEVEDVASIYPTYVVHAYHDTGTKMTLEDGREIPILRPQTSFGYFALHEGSLHGWETRLYGAVKVAENVYRVGVPNNGSVYVETVIQARQFGSETALPPDGQVSRCGRLVNWLETKGWIGRALAVVVQFICRLFGG